ncbi:hypothetical protein B0O80DRAFT_496677 [Mortierella sp. GBAus27b]|nr:hypothetical protein B0O80DRAFT_496677 [Mortierella sp. GBAus27b]
MIENLRFKSSKEATTLRQSGRTNAPMPTDNVLTVATMIPKRGSDRLGGNSTWKAVKLHASCTAQPTPSISQVNLQHIPINMTFFKLSSASKKNKTASAATTPAQTPRTSVQLGADDIEAVHKNMVMSQDATLQGLFLKGTVGHMQALTLSRM